MVAEWLITRDELGSKLAALGEIRKVAEMELEALNKRRQKFEILEEDADTLVNSYPGLLPEALNNLYSQERHSIYKMLGVWSRRTPTSRSKLRGVCGGSGRL